MKRLFVILLLLSLFCVLPVSSQDARYFGYTKYEKTEINLKDFRAVNKNSKAVQRNKFLQRLVRDTYVSDTFNISFSADERVIRVRWRKHPRKQCREILAINRDGMDGVLNGEDIIDYFTHRNFPDFSIYDDILVFNGQKIPSPIGPNRRDYYEYDVVEHSDTSQTLSFAPKGGEISAKSRYYRNLTGTIKLTRDSLWRISETYFLVHDLTSSKRIHEISILQNYFTDQNGFTLPTRTHIFIELHKWGFLGKAQLTRTKKYFDYTEDTIPDGKRCSKLVYDGMADYRNPAYWTRYDRELSADLWDNYVQDSLDCHKMEYDSTGIVRRRQSDVQKQICNALDYINSNGWGMNVLTFPAKAFVNNFIELGKRPVFDIEPVTSIFSYNTEDHFRIRAGGFTTANLFKRLFLGGYVAYGFNSKKVYGQAKALYSFIDKKYEPTEFPQRSISVEYRNDICYLGERNDHNDHDNLFKSFEWGKYARMMFFNLQKVKCEWDLSNGLGFIASIKRENDTATGRMTFRTKSQTILEDNLMKEGVTTIYPDNGSICTTELRFEVIYYPPSKRFKTGIPRAPINGELPLMSIAHNYGVKFLGGQYNYHLSLLRIEKDWFLGNYGIANTTLKAGYLWNTVPFPLLLAPPANTSYIIDSSSFSLLTKSEFLSDRYIQLLVSWETDGNLIGLIPLIKRLRWKEFVSVKMLWGALSDKNNPTLQENKESDILMPFPHAVYAMAGDRPYFEGTVGIHNIFHIINLDYVFRFNYLDVPDSTPSGVRVSVVLDI